MTQAMILQVHYDLVWHKLWSFHIMSDLTR